MAGLLEELDLGPAVLAGYDIGSRIAQTLAQQHPERVAALVVTPPVPGVGRRVLEPDAQRAFWYQTSTGCRSPTKLLDGSPAAVRAYLRHFWDAWSAPGWALPDEDLDALAARYAEPGALTASLGWYRAGAGTVARSLGETPPDAGARIATPTAVSGPRTTRCSPGRGGTGSASSSPTSPSPTCPTPGTSCRSRRPGSSPPRS